MTVAIPVAIKSLSSLNQDLIRNTTSYLSLAAIHNGRIISQYSVQIITNILNGWFSIYIQELRYVPISGNYSLVRVLPQIYSENREPFHAHLTQLFRLLHNPATDVSEQLSLLQLASMVANAKPEVSRQLSLFEQFFLFGSFKLIVPHLVEFDKFLMNSTTCK